MSNPNSLNPIVQGMQDALLNRMAPHAHPLTGRARRHVAQSLLEMGRELMALRGERAEGMSRFELSGHLLNQRLASRRDDLPRADAAHTPAQYIAALRQLAGQAPGAAFTSAVLGTLDHPTGVHQLRADEACSAANRSRALQILAAELLQSGKREIWRYVPAGRDGVAIEVRGVMLWNGTVQAVSRYTGTLIAQSVPGLPWLLAPWLH